LLEWKRKKLKEFQKSIKTTFFKPLLVDIATIESARLQAVNKASVELTAPALSVSELIII